VDPGPKIPDVEREVFPHPPLKAMLGQVRFPPILRIVDLGSLGGFQDAIRASWPMFAQEQQINVQIGPQGLQQAGTARALRFTASDSMWSALLTPDSLTMEADLSSGRYTSYEEFSERFAELWAALVDHFQPGGIVQQGLRYVDHFERDLPAAAWAEFINPELLGPLTGTFGTGVMQTLSDLRFRRDDGVLVFKHGIVPAGPDDKPGYLLDFDYFMQEQDDDISVDAVVKRFNSYHDVIYAFFRWCLTSRTLEELRDGN
jgi:uncharacterized protein (TIGR04255 family)